MADINFNDTVSKWIKNISEQVQREIKQKMSEKEKDFSLTGTVKKGNSLEENLNVFIQFYKNIANMGYGLSEAQALKARRELQMLHPSGEEAKSPALRAAYTEAVSALNKAVDSFLPESQYATPYEAQRALRQDEEYKDLVSFEKLVDKKLDEMSVRVKAAESTGGAGAKMQKQLKSEQAAIVSLIEKKLPNAITTRSKGATWQVREKKTPIWGKTIKPKITIEKGFEEGEPDKEILDIKSMSEALMSGMTEAQKKAFQGHEVRERYGKFGKDVSSVTNIGRGLGTHLSKFEQMVKEAKENGYETVVRATSDGYEVRLIPSTEYRENANINWDNKEGKIQFKVGLASNGRIGGKIDAIQVNTEFEKGKDGQKGRAYTLLESSSARQLDGIVGFLRSNKFKSGSMTADESSSFMQSLVNSAVNGNISLVAGDEETSEYFSRNKVYKGENKTATEIMKSMEVSFKDYMMSALRNEKVQKVITDYKRRTGYYKDYTFDPDNVSQDVTNAMLDAFIRGGRYGEEELASGLTEDTLLKALVESDAMRYYLKNAHQIIGATGISMTARSEGSGKTGKYGVIPQGGIVPFASLADMLQRDTAQGQATRELTQRAKEARANLISPVFTVAGARQAGFNYEDESQKMYKVMQIPEQEFYKAAQSYFESIGLTGDELKLSLQSLMDNIIASKDVIEGTESWRYKASKSAALSEINGNFLKQYGLDLSQFGDAQVGDVIELSHTVGEGEDTAFSSKFHTKVGDQLTALVKTIDGWKLETQSLSESQQGAKMVLGLGGRMSMGGGRNPAELFAYVQDYLMKNWAKTDAQREAIGSVNAFVEERTELKERNFLLDFAGQLNTIVEAMKQRGNSNKQIYEVLVSQNPVFGKMFKMNGEDIEQVMTYDAKDGRFVDAEGFGIFNPNETTMMSYINEEGVLTTEIVTEGQKLLAGLDELGQNLLGDDYNKIKGVLSTSIGQQDVAVWAKTSGAGKFTPRVSNDFKVTNAGIRTRAFFGGLAMQGKSGEEKESLQKGLDIIKAAHEKLNTTLSPVEIAARKDFSQVIEAQKSFRVPYTKTGAGKDIEFVSKEDFSSLEENQIYIEDTVTDLKNAIEKGRVKPEDYEKFIMEVARKKKTSLVESGKSEYADANFILNRAQGGKLMFANVESGQDKEYNYYISTLERQQGKVLRAYAEYAAATEEEKAQKEAEYKNMLYEMQKLYIEVATNKDSKLVDQATHVAQGHSGYGVAQGRAFDTELTEYSEDAARLANTVVVSQDRFRSMYSTEARSTKKQILENVQALAHQYNLRTGSNLSQKDSTGGKSFAQANKNELVKAEQKIITMIIEAIKAGNSNFVAEMGRFPYNQGTEGVTSHIAIGEVGDEVLSVSQGLAKYLHGDFDGDYYRMIANVFDATYGKDAYNVEQEMQKIQDKYIWIMQQFASAEKMNGISDKRANLMKVAKSLEDKSTNEFASIFAGSNFQNIGTFSQSATKMRENMRTLGYDTGNTSTEEDMRKSFNADVVKAFLQTLEQDAISSKKIYARLEQIKAEKGEEFSLEQAGDEVWHLIQTLRSGDFTGFINEAINMGIYKDTMADQPIQSLRARWMSNDTTKNFLQNYVGEDFVSMNAGAGLSSEFVQRAFADVQSYLQSRNANLNIGDMITDSKRWRDWTRTTYNGRERISTNVVNPNLLNGTQKDAENNGMPSVSTGRYSIDSDGTIVINTTGNVLVNAQGDINTTQIVQQMAEAAKEGIAQGATQTNAKTGKIIHEMRNESGKFVTPQVTWDSVTPPDAKTHAMSVKMNGKIYGKDDIFSVTEALNHDKEPTPFEKDKMQYAAVMGTYGHRIVQELVNTGEELTETFDEQVENELTEIVGKSVSEGGLNMDSSDPKVQKQRKLAELMVAKARETGLVNENTITERTMAGLFGDQMFAGTMDALTYDKETGYSMVDWKFSKAGGPEDLQKRGERMAQMQVYFAIYEKMLEKLSNQVFERNKEITKADADYFGLIGNNSDEWANDLTERLNHIRKGNVKFSNVRGFEEDGEQLVEIISSGLNVALSLEQVAELLEKGVQGKALPFVEIAKNMNLQSLFGSTTKAMSPEVPEQVQRRIDKKNAEATGASYTSQDQAIKKYLAQYKQILNLQASIDGNEKRLQGRSGESAENTKAVIAAQKRQLALLQAEVPQLNLEEGTLNGEPIKNQETLLNLKKQIAKLEGEQAIKLEKNNSLARQHVSFIQQIADGFKASFRNLTDYSMAYAVIGKIRMAYSQLIQYTEQLNASMVNLQIASGLSYSTIKDMMLDFNELASEVGKSTVEVAEAANDWLRAGYEGSEATQLTNASMHLSTLGMIESSQATSYLISVLKGWKIEAAEVMEVVDKLTVTICSVCRVIGIGHKLKSR